MKKNFQSIFTPTTSTTEKHTYQFQISRQKCTPLKKGSAAQFENVHSHTSEIRADFDFAQTNLELIPLRNREVSLTSAILEIDIEVSILSRISKVSKEKSFESHCENVRLGAV